MNALCVNIGVSGNLNQTYLKNIMISATQLKQVIEQRTTDERSLLISQFLFEAINDWPTSNLTEPNEFIETLKNEVGLKLRLNDLKLFSKQLNFSSDSWKIESLESIFKIFEIFDKENELQIELEKIIDLIVITKEQSCR
ncbi:MAG: hypothetical protein J0M05_02470 [Candidatus Kapabacteria bacterium]|nr:hypothetical protein [Candidatus Kapabacteria bacterium]